jgi:hypothetical protein
MPSKNCPPAGRNPVRQKSEWCPAGIRTGVRQASEYAALQPDAPNYDFDRYFRWDYTLGTIEVNEQASPEDQRRANVTIKLYKLNDGHPSLRKRELRKRAKDARGLLDDFAYRDYVGGP